MRYPLAPVCPRPVSYTHLDVYKRQIYATALCSRRPAVPLIFLPSVFFLVLIIDRAPFVDFELHKGQHCEDHHEHHGGSACVAQMERLERLFINVLDVYKRQQEAVRHVLPAADGQALHRQRIRKAPYLYTVGSKQVKSRRTPAKAGPVFIIDPARRNVKGRRDGPKRRGNAAEELNSPPERVV